MASTAEAVWIFPDSQCLALSAVCSGVKSSCSTWSFCNNSLSVFSAVGALYVSRLFFAEFTSRLTHLSTGNSGLRSDADYGYCHCRNQWKMQHVQQLRVPRQVFFTNNRVHIVLILKLTTGKFLFLWCKHSCFILSRKLNKTVDDHICSKFSTHVKDTLKKEMS